MKQKLPSRGTILKLIEQALDEGRDRETIERLQWFLHYKTHGQVSKTCKEFGIARSTFYRWLKRFNPDDFSATNNSQPTTNTSTTLSTGNQKLLLNSRAAFLLALFLINIGVLLFALPTLASAASSWNPTLLVSTESFERIDDSDTDSDVYLEFGETLQERLMFKRNEGVFATSRGLRVGGNLSATGSISASGAINASGGFSGTTLHTVGNASMSGTLSVEGNISSSGTLVIESASSLKGAATFGSTLTLNGITYTFPSADGDNGQVLSTNGGGTLSWATGGGEGSNYFAGKGLDLTSSFFSLSDTLTGTSLEVTGTSSGLTVHAQDMLQSSGALSVEGLFRHQNASDTTFAFQVFDTDGGNPVFNVDTTNERVGIGTASPSTALEVVGKILATNNIHVNGDNLGLWLNSDGTTYNYGIYTNGGKTFIREDGNDILVIDGSNLGINDSTPQTRLDVAGVISGTALKITGTADFGSTVTITEGALTDDKIVEGDLKAVDAASDEDILTFETTTGDFEWHSKTDLGIGTATAITDGLIVEPDLDADNSPSDADILTYDSTGTNFAWITANAGTDITADLEEETHASEHASGGGDAVDHDTLTNFVAAEHVDWAGASAGTIHTDNYIEDDDLGVNEVYGSGWNADTDSPEKDDIYDYLHQIDTNDDGDVDNIDATALAAAETDPTLTNDAAVTIGAGGGNVTLTFDSDGGTDGTILWDGTNDQLEIASGDIGIGTIAPTAKFMIAQSVNGTGALIDTEATTAPALAIDTVASPAQVANAPHILFGYRGKFDVKMYRAGTGALRVASDSGATLTLDSESSTATDNVMRIYSDRTTDENIIWRVQADGKTFADGAYSAAGADYAEWFPTQEENLVSGELVCIDTNYDKSIKRCTGGLDDIFVGVVSTEPGFVGGYSDEVYEGTLVLVGLIGQVMVEVSDESGLIKRGDVLTPSNDPGVARKATPWDKNHKGIALIAIENQDEPRDKIKVLIK